jgi:hypothetical protein
LPPSDGDAAQEAWLAVEGEAPVRFIFADTLRADAARRLQTLKAQGLSGGACCPATAKGRWRRPPKPLGWTAGGPR